MAFSAHQLLTLPGVLETFRASPGDFRAIDLSPDGSEVVFSWDIEGAFDLYIVSVSGGTARRVTANTPDDRSMNPRFSPDGRWIAFLRDHHDDELFHIWVIGRDGQGARRLTEAAANREMLEWTPDGARLVYRSHESGTTGISTIDAATGASRSVVANLRDPGADHITPDISRDGSFIAYHTATVDDPRNVVIEVVSSAGGTPWRLDTHPGAIARAVLPRWSPDGSWLAFDTDHRGRPEVALLPMRNGRQQGEPRYLSETTFDEAVMGWGGTGALLYRRNAESAITIRRVDLTIGRDDAVIPERGVVYSVCEAKDGTLVYVWTSPTSTPDVYARRPGGPARQLTSSMPKNFDRDTLVQPTHVTYPGADDVPIPALLFQPRRGSVNERELPPAIVYAHGGGSWQHLQAWDETPQWFANNGYVVLAPNARGSKGYGRAFREANRGDRGGVDVLDHARGADWLEREGVADGRRIAAYGTSGGGYTTVAAITKIPDRWAAACTVRGLVSYTTFMKATRTDLQGMMRSIVGVTAEAQPLDLVERIRCPVLILHGRTDPRVPVSEAERFAEALKQHGKRFVLHVYPDEGHGFRNPANRRDALLRIVDFFDEHVKARGSDAFGVASPS